MHNWNGLALALRRLGLHSLQSQLFACLLAPMLLLTAINGWLVYASALDIARPVVDQMLVGSARTIGEDIQTEGGRLSVETPPAALENLKTSARDHVYYRVDSPRQGLLAGTEDIAPFDGHLGIEEWVGYDAAVQGQDIHVVAFAQPVFPFGEGDLVIIQVGATERARHNLAERIWLRAMWPQGLLLLAAVVFGRLWARAAIAPASRIGEAVRRREPESLESLEIRDAPTELEPLVESIDGYIQRIRHHIDEHDRFISNAAHQLKTPITVLNTQTMVGLRSDDVATKQRALQANHETLQHCIRLIRQLLTLSAADANLGRHVPAVEVDLAECAREALEELAEAADRKNIDLGFVNEAGDPATVRGVASLLRALIANLVDNAIRYTPAGGAVTLALGRNEAGLLLTVEDSGPGIAVSEREHVFERFYRLRDDADQEGSGLGLPIVREIARACGADVSLNGRDDGASGLLVRVVFPAVAADPR